MNYSAVVEHVERLDPHKLRRILFWQRLRCVIVTPVAKLILLASWGLFAGVIVGSIALGYFAPKELLYRYVSGIWAEGLALAWAGIILFAILSTSGIKVVGAKVRAIQHEVDEWALTASCYVDAIGSRIIRLTQEDQLSSLTAESAPARVIQLVERVADAGNHESIVTALQSRGSVLFAKWSTGDLLALIFAMYPHDQDLADHRYEFLHEFFKFIGKDRSLALLRLFIDSQLVLRGGSGVMFWLHFQRYVYDESIDNIFRPENRPKREPWLVVQSQINRVKNIDIA
ncbi:MAG: hypothetical protein ACKVRP_12280 [Bacteroidota bacterium]